MYCKVYKKREGEMYIKKIKYLKLIISLVSLHVA